MTKKEQHREPKPLNPSKDPQKDPRVKPDHLIHDPGNPNKVKITQKNKPTSTK